jgi:hypothetical protein
VLMEDAVKILNAEIQAQGQVLNPPKPVEVKMPTFTANISKIAMLKADAGKIE